MVLLGGNRQPGLTIAIIARSWSLVFCEGSGY